MRQAESILYRLYREMPPSLRVYGLQVYFCAIEALNILHSMLPYAIHRRLFSIYRIHLAKGVAIHRGVRFSAIGHCQIGAHTIVNRDCFLDNRGGLVIGANVSIAHECSIFTMGHDINAPDFALNGAPVEIGDYACIFAKALIMPGIKIGRGAVVYPGAIVTKDVPEMAVVGGNPAKVIKFRECDLDYILKGRLYVSP